MEKQLNGILDKLRAMLARAEELADSENETTSAKYEQAVESITEAIDALETAFDS